MPPTFRTIRLYSISIKHADTKEQLAKQLQCRILRRVVFVVVFALVDRMTCFVSDMPLRGLPSTSFSLRRAVWCSPGMGFSFSATAKTAVQKFNRDALKRLEVYVIYMYIQCNFCVKCMACPSLSL